MFRQLRTSKLALGLNQNQETRTASNLSWSKPPSSKRTSRNQRHRSQAGSVIFSRPSSRKNLKWWCLENLAMSPSTVEEGTQCWISLQRPSQYSLIRRKRQSTPSISQNQGSSTLNSWMTLFRIWSQNQIIRASLFKREKSKEERRTETISKETQVPLNS